MEFTILGPLEARAGGRVLPLGGPKQRAVLAQLLLSAGEVVSRDRLVEGTLERPAGLGRQGGAGARVAAPQGARPATRRS